MARIISYFMPIGPDADLWLSRKRLVYDIHVEAGLAVHMTVDQPRFRLQGRCAYGSPATQTV